MNDLLDRAGRWRGFFDGVGLVAGGFGRFGVCFGRLRGGFSRLGMHFGRLRGGFSRLEASFSRLRQL